MSYGGLTRENVGELLGVSDATVGRMTSRVEPAGASLDQLLVVGRAAGVPDWFMAHGFSPPADGVGDEVRQQLAAMDERLAELDADLRREQLARADLVSVLQEVVGTDLRAALATARAR